MKKFFISCVLLTILLIILSSCSKSPNPITNFDTGGIYVTCTFASSSRALAKTAKSPLTDTIELSELVISFEGPSESFTDSKNLDGADSAEIDTLYEGFEEGDWLVITATISITGDTIHYDSGTVHVFAGENADVNWNINPLKTYLVVGMEEDSTFPDSIDYAVLFIDGVAMDTVDWSSKEREFSGYLDIGFEYSLKVVFYSEDGAALGKAERKFTPDGEQPIDGNILVTWYNQPKSTGSMSVKMTFSAPNRTNFTIITDPEA